MKFSKSFTISIVPLLLLATCENSQCYRILALLPVDARSHFVMAESLMKGLAARGNQVDVVSHFPLKVPVPNYTDLSLDGISPLNIFTNLSIVALTKYPFVSMKRMTRGGIPMCSLLAHPTLQKIIKHSPDDQPYDLIITQMFISPCYLAVGRHLGVPTVGLSTSRDWLSETLGDPASTAFVPNIFSSYSQSMTFWERLVNTLEHVLYSIQLDYYTEAQNELVRKHVHPEIPDVRQLYEDLALLLVNSHHSMARIRPRTPAVVEVAGLHLNDDTRKLDLELETWLNRSQSGCIYFTTGSIVRIETFPREKLEALYEAFRRISPVTVLMKVADEKDLPPGLPQNVKTRAWFSQIEVLKHKNVRGFISHGGIFGIQEAIYTAVPLIGIPLFGDQKANVNTFARKKILYPLSLSEINADNVEKAIKAILTDPIYSENIKKLNRLFLDRPMKPLDTAIYWIEYVAKHGNVLRSPSLDISWWQRSLLDVYATLLLSLLFVFYVTLRFLVFKPFKGLGRYLGQRKTSENRRLTTSTTKTKELITKKTK